MNESDYFAHTCRLCLTKSPQNIDIFSEECVKSSVQSKTHLMFSVSVKPDEDLPRTICGECFKTIEFISTFKLNVENAQNTIMLLLSELARSEKCDDVPVQDFLKSPEEGSYEGKSSVDISDEMCEMTETSETFIITDDYDGFDEPHNKHIKLEETCEMVIVTNYDDKDYSCSEDNQSLLPTEQVIEFVEVDQVEDTYSSTENSIGSSDSEESSKNIPVKKGKRRKQKMLKRSEIGKDQVENKSNKPAWTDNMEEEVQNFYQFTCELCSDNQPFKNFTSLCRHYRAAHDTEGYLKCCKRKMYCRSHLYQHMILHTRPEMYKCPECDKQLCGLIYLKQHLQVFHLPKTELPFRCSVCARGFATKTAVENHEKSQHFLSHEEKFVHECDICGKRFASVAGVSEHKKQVHEQLRPLLCDICAKSFPNQSRLRKHMTSHSTSENVKCPHCDQRLKNYGRLQVHLKRHQGVIHTCQQCEKTYPTRRLLQ